MIIVNLTDQLGNQMFAYAAIKTMCMQKNLEFRYFKQVIDEKYINDKNKKYGHELDTIFNIPEEERIGCIPDGFPIYWETPIKKRKKGYEQEILKIEDNTFVRGHYMSVKYFENNLEEVRKWFSFPEDVIKECENEIINIKNQFLGRPIISVHFRVGKDYVKGGFKINDRYWVKAAEHAKDSLSAEPVFLVFYDRKTKAVDKFIKKFQAAEFHNTLVEDMCLISKCDGHIISNSSFSTMSVLLNQKEPKIVVKPSVYPVSSGFLPQSVFSDSWKMIKAKRDFISKLWFFMIKVKSLFNNTRK